MYYVSCCLLNGGLRGGGGTTEFEIQLFTDKIINYPELD